MATVLISEAEKVYVLHGVQENIRVDGRGRKDVRPIVFESGLVSLIWIILNIHLNAPMPLFIFQKSIGTPSSISTQSPFLLPFFKQSESWH